MAPRTEDRPEQGSIGTIEELIRVLNERPTPAGYTAVMHRLDIHAADLSPLCIWDDDRYTRKCLHRTPEHELLLICYGPGQHTSIHDYDSQMAWIKPILGSVFEERFKHAGNGDLKLQGQRKLEPGPLVYMTTKDCIHRHTNPGPGRAITLNLYVRPIRRWRVYDERTGRSALAGTSQLFRQ